MRSIKIFTLLILSVATLASCNDTKSELYEASVNYSINDGVITLDEPMRAKGQHSVLELRTAPMDTVRVGFVGLGMRGPGAVERFTYIDGVAINGLCDKYIERAEHCQVYLERAGMPKAKIYAGDEGYKALCESEDVDSSLLSMLRSVSSRRFISIGSDR